jgi:mediator of RNA polymerase II transcription subunit 7
LARLRRELYRRSPRVKSCSGSLLTIGLGEQLKDELQSLEAAGIRRLGPRAPADCDSKDGRHTDRALELKKMAKSLLLNFLELMGTMSINPEQGESKVNDIKELLINFHHVLNEYRPHQARESLIMLMQDQLDKKRAETEAIRRATENAKRELAKLGDLVIGDSNEASSSYAAGDGQPAAEVKPWVQEDRAPWARQKSLWESLDSEFG